MLLEMLLVLAIFLFIVVPIVYLIHSWSSKHTACPFCGEKILKSDRICPHCSVDLQKLDTVDKKIITVGKAFREGAEMRTRSDDEIEKRFRSKNQ